MVSLFGMVSLFEVAKVMSAFLHASIGYGLGERSNQQGWVT